MGAAGTKGMPRSERETQILDIASEHISQHGYAGLSTDAVAAAAGVSKPMVYHYFGGKPGLYIACVNRAAETVCGAIDAVFDEPDPEQMIEQTLAIIFQALAEHPFNWTILQDTTHPAEGPAADAARAARDRRAAQAARGAVAVLGARGIHDPVDLSAFTEVWMATVGALVDWWIRHPETSTDAMIARCRRLMGTLWSGTTAASSAGQHDG